MALELTCFNVSFLLPTIPTINNVTNILSHSYYNPNGKAISQLISSSLDRTTFSIADVRSFLKIVTSDDIKSWDVSTIVKIKPMTSTIIYSSVTLALFILLSLIFCIISCTNCCKRKSFERRRRMKKRKCSGQRICVVLILLIGLIVIGQMIYVAYQVSRTKLFLDDSIKEMNQEIYPKEISLYLQHLLQQLEQLDQYSTQTDSILIKASHAIFVEAFNQIFQEKYFLDKIRQSVTDSDEHINELSELIDQDTSLSPETIDLFQAIKIENRRMIDDLKIPLQELCDYANGTETEIDDTIFDAFNLVHQQLRKLIDTIQNDFLSHITPWQNAMLMNKDLEGQVRWYVRLGGIILLVLILMLGLIPIVFFILIIICRLSRCQRTDSLSNYRMNKNRQNGWRRQSQSSIESEGSVSNVKSSNCSPRVVLCWMRIVFTPMMILLIVIVLLTGVLYGVDLVAQGACRMVHDDQPFLVSFLIDQLLGTNSSDLIIGGSDVQTTFITIIDDCRNQIHFSQHFLKNHLIRLENDVDYAMNQLNEKIFDKFNASIDDIDIASDIDRLAKFSIATNSTKIQDKVQEIENDFKTIETQFEKITVSVPTLPTNVVNQTIEDFKGYLKRVLESTVDTCPLPLATIYKTDTFICHNLAKSISGLWLSLFVYMFFIIFGLCICGLCIYKRSQSFSSNRSITVTTL